MRICWSGSQHPPGQNLGHPCLCPLLFSLWEFDKCPHDILDLQTHQYFVHWPALICSQDDQHCLHSVYPLHHWFEYGVAYMMHGNRLPFLPVFWSMKVINTMSNRRRNGLLWRICMNPLRKHICFLKGCRHILHNRPFLRLLDMVLITFILHNTGRKGKQSPYIT